MEKMLDIYKINNPYIHCLKVLDEYVVSMSLQILVPIIALIFSSLPNKLYQSMVRLYRERELNLILNIVVGCGKSH